MYAFSASVFTNNYTIYTALFVFILSYICYKLTFWKRQHLPNICFSGQNYFTKPRHHVDKELIEKYGKIVGIYELLRPVLIVAEPEAIKKVLVTDFNDFMNHKQFIVDHAPGSYNLFNLKLNNWRRVRSIVSPAFTALKLKKMAPLIMVCLDQLILNLTESAKSGLPVDVKKPLGFFSLDVIASTAFGTNINSLHDQENLVVKAAEKFFGINISLMAIFALLCPSLAFALRINVFDVKGLIYLKQLAVAIVNQRKMDPTTIRDDFLKLLMEAEDQEKEVNDSSKKLTMDEITDQGIVFLVAAYDSTSTLLSSLLYCLALNPDIQKRLINEIDDFVKGGRGLDWDAINDLKYLDAVLWETLRFMSPVARVERIATTDCHLGEIFIPKGTLIAIPVHAVQRDPDNYEEPDVFNPDRFFEQSIKERSACKLIPFAARPRNCIGYRFAMFELKLAITELLKKFKFHVCPETEIPLEYYSGQVVATPKSVTLTVELRELD